MARLANIPASDLGFGFLVRFRVKTIKVGMFRVYLTRGKGSTFAVLFCRERCLNSPPPPTFIALKSVFSGTYTEKRAWVAWGFFCFWGGGGDKCLKVVTFLPSTLTYLFHHFHVFLHTIHYFSFVKTYLSEGSNPSGKCV